MTADHAVNISTQDKNTVFVRQNGTQWKKNDILTNFKASF